MKGILEYDLNDFDEKLAHKRACNADSAYIALHEIANLIFRPNRKHGYSKEIEELFEKCEEIKTDDGYDTNAGTEIIDKLESMFYSILQDNGIDLDDLR